MYLNQMIVKIYYKLYYNILKIICILFHKVKIWYLIKVILVIKVEIMEIMEMEKMAQEIIVKLIKIMK